MRFEILLVYMIIIRKIKLYKIDKKIVNESVNHLAKGGILIYPADTCYGVGVDFTNKNSILNLSILKNRKEDKHFSIIVPDFNWIKQNSVINKNQEETLRKNLPGEFTFILKTKNKEIDSPTLGIRIPNNLYCQMIVRKLNNPIVSTSANISGENNPYTTADLEKGILKRTQYINDDIFVLNAGELIKDKISTVVDLTKDPFEIVRQGSGKLIYNL